MAKKCTETYWVSNIISEVLSSYSTFQHFVEVTPKPLVLTKNTFIYSFGKKLLTKKNYLRLRINVRSRRVYGVDHRYRCREPFEGHCCKPA